jgi:hypothetical protein
MGVPAGKVRPPNSLGGIKITLNLSRASVATLDRIRAKRLEAGGSRREAQAGRLVEEAIQLLRRKEGI